MREHIRDSVSGISANRLRRFCQSLIVLSVLEGHSVKSSCCGFGSGLLSNDKGWQDIKDWFAYARSLPTIEEELNKLPHPNYMDKSVYVIHMPPSRLGLDKCSHGAEVGSQAIYNFIERNQPLLTLHGHIHESPSMTGKWSAKLGQAVCIQPGQLRELSYVVIDLDTMQCEHSLQKIA